MKHHRKHKHVHARKGHRKGTRRVVAAVAHGARKTKHAVRRVVAATRRRFSRRSSNPRGLLSSPAVKMTGAVLLGAAVGRALDGMVDLPAWVPPQITPSMVGGAIGAAVAYRTVSGDKRQLALAASLGCAGQGLIGVVADQVSGMLPAGTSTAAPAMRRMGGRPAASLPAPQGSGLSSTAQAAQAAMSNRNPNLFS